MLTILLFIAILTIDDFFNKKTVLPNYVAVFESLLDQLSQRSKIIFSVICAIEFFKCNREIFPSVKASLWFKPAAFLIVGLFFIKVLF